MKNNLFKILLMLFVAVAAVFWSLNYVFLNKDTARKSKAAGETMELSFNPNTKKVAANEDFTVTVLAKPSVNTVIRGYKTNVKFDKTALKFKSIKYKTGVVSSGIGDSDADAGAINKDGNILVVGEDRTAAGSTLSSANGAELVSITFTALNDKPNVVLFDESVIFSVGSNGAITNPWTYKVDGLSVNGGIIPSPTSANPTDDQGPILTKVILNLKLKFQGINKKPTVDELSSMKVRVILQKEGTKKGFEDTGTFSADDKGVWSGKVAFPIESVEGRWVLYVKGPQHIQKRVCDVTPKEDSIGLYHCGTGDIELAFNDNNLDFTGINFLVGDINQNGLVDAVDIATVKNNLGKKDIETLIKADLNRDGVVNTQDFSLILFALTTRTDEGDTLDVVKPTTNPNSTIQPTNPNPTDSSPNPTITNTGATGDLLRDGSTYPVYFSLSFLGCKNYPATKNSVASLTMSFLGKQETYANQPLKFLVTDPLLISDKINVNDILAKDLHKGDTKAEFNEEAALIIQATQLQKTTKKLNQSQFNLIWCTNTNGCFGTPDNLAKILKEKRYIYFTLFKVCQ